jgi:hypothetical protein
MNPNVSLNNSPYTDTGQAWLRLADDDVFGTRPTRSLRRHGRISVEDRKADAIFYRWACENCFLDV